MTKIHLLFSGPIRPNIDCVKYVLTNYIDQFNKYEIITYLSTWKTDITSEEELKLLFDHVIIQDEP